MDQPETHRIIRLLESIVTTPSAKAWLAQVSEKKLSVEQLKELSLGRFGIECAETSVRDLVVELDRRARLYAQTRLKESNPQADPEQFEWLWVTARLLEWYGQSGHPPLCKFCYRTVELRSNGRPMDYCAHHAQSGKAKNPAGYVRGRKAYPDFDRRLKELTETDDADQPGNYVWVIADVLLRKQFQFANAGGGDAAYLLESFLSRKLSASFDSVSAQVINIDSIKRDYPSVSEMALRWRKEAGDKAGYDALRHNNNLCVSLHTLIQQWVRYIAWHDAGDRTARVGSGRPSRIDSDQIQKMLNENMSMAEIARRFGVKPGSVYAHVARKAAKVTEPKGAVEAAVANDIKIG